MFLCRFATRSMIRIISKKDFNPPTTTQWENDCTIGHILLLTILGLNGGVTCLASNLSQSISLKNGWSRMLCSPLAVQPSLFWQFFVMNCRTKTKISCQWQYILLCIKGGGGTLFKLQDDNFKSCIARATSVRYPANHLQHTLGTRGFFARATRSFVSLRLQKTRAAKSFKTRPKPETAYEKSLAPKVPTTPCCRSKLNGKWPIKLGQKILT